ncbi:hypothetical protein HYS82_03915 [Candidatus Amesbacteria bacterium]|nr:hypothetical protein [Candidatus Amesbacteria bacterium]MBI2587434.1 hypothetical protein [Candidatus Amesbacteria bacterium]
MHRSEQDPIFETALGQMDSTARRVRELFVAAADEYRRTGRPLDAEEAAELIREEERLQEESDVYAGIAWRNMMFRYGVVKITGGEGRV